MRIKLTSVFVDDQEKALKFHTEVLGFVKKRNCRPGTSSSSPLSLRADTTSSCSRTECKSSRQGAPESDPRSRNPIHFVLC